MAHIGSWGTPELGFTELLQSWFKPNIASTPQGGSNLLGGYVSPLSSSYPSSSYKAPTNTGTVTNSGTGPVSSGTVLGTNNNQTQLDQEKAWEQQNQPSGEPSGPSEYDMMRNNWRNQVNNIYDPLISYLDKLAGTLPGWKEEKLGAINDLFSSQSGELESNKEDQFNKLAANKEEVKADERVNMKSLGENFRNWLQTGQNQLGVWGAGDSSASGMYKFALAKQVAKRGTDIARQVAKSINDIKMKEADVQSAFNTAKRELDRWLTTNTQQVKDWFNEKKQAIDTQKATAIGDKANALAQAEMSLMQDAYNRLQTIQSQAQEYDSKMKDWALNTMASLNEYKVQMGQMGQYTPQEIAYQNLQGANQIMANTAGENPYWNIYGTAKKKFAEDWG
jgi:hypothetical protein